MGKNKTGLIVLTILAAVFFLFLAILFNSSTKRQAAIDRKADLDAKFDVIAGADISIFWIGEPEQEFEHLMPVVNVINPAAASRENLPVRTGAFHFTEYTPDGTLIQEEIPADYPDYMVIILSGSPELTDGGKEALHDAVALNGVPVLAIGSEACDALGEVLSYRMVHKKQGSSLYYCLGKGYKENPVPEEKVNKGGMDLAEAIPDIIKTAVSDYMPQT